MVKTHIHSPLRNYVIDIHIEQSQQHYYKMVILLLFS